MMKFAPLLLVFCLSPMRAQAQISLQTVRGTVTVIGTQTPVAGSVVTALSGSGAELERTLTNERGQFILRVPESATQLRVLRIGFSPRIVPLPRARAESIDVDISLAILQTMLDVVDVRDNSNCAPRRDRATALALFEQVRHGLLATIVARETFPAHLKLLRFQRYMVEQSARIHSQDVFVDSVSSQTRSFQAVRSAADFVAKGFAQDSAGELTFFAPDAESMLDESFRLGYCFRLVNADRARRGHVGLAFSVAKRVEGKVDIDGTIWVDTAARSLRSIEYNYLGLDPRRQSFRPGGRVEFREMPNGTVLVDRWSLRLVAIRIDSVRRALLRPLVRTMYEIHETGGELAQVRWPDGTRWQAPLGMVQLSALTRDSLPAVGVRVTLENTPYRGATDRTGSLTFTDLLPGPYTVQVIDTVMAKINVALDARVPFTSVRDSSHRSTFVVPTAMDYARATCPAEPQDAAFIRYDPDRGVRESVLRQRDRSVAFFVYVTDPNGEPVSDVSITEALAPRDRMPTWHEKATGGKTDRDGRYFSCWSYHVGERVQLWIQRDGQAPQLTLVPLTERVHAIRITSAVDK